MTNPSTSPRSTSDWLATVAAALSGLAWAALFSGFLLWTNASSLATSGFLASVVGAVLALVLGVIALGMRTPSRVAAWCAVILSALLLLMLGAGAGLLAAFLNGLSNLKSG